MNPTRATWLFLIALTAVRLSMLSMTDLEFDEAHYWMWSERPAPAYFSKGPGVAFAIRATTAVFGANEFGVRVLSPLLGAGTSLLLFYFAKRLFGEKAGLWTVLGLNATPIYNIGSFVMTIDPLSIFFWTAAMFAFWMATEKSPRFSVYWPLTGVLIGLGFLCKYTNALELVSILLVLALAPRLRGEFKRSGFYWLIGGFALFTIPPIVWNAQHAWITLTHLRSRGSLEEGFGFHAGELLMFIAQHFAVFSPILFAAVVWAIIRSWRRVGQQLKVLFLMWFGLPVLVFYLLLSINKTAAPNWDGLAFLSLTLLTVYYWRDQLEASLRLRQWAAAGIVLGIVLSVIALDTDILRTFGFHLRKDASNRMRAWKSATAAVENLRHDLETKLGEKLFLIADERDRASETSFYLRDKRVEGPQHPPVYIVESQAILNQFSFWPRYDEFVEAPPAKLASGEDVYTEEKGANLFVGRSALFVRDGEGNEVPHNIRVAFQSTEQVGTIEVRRFGDRVRLWQVFLCRSYRTLPL